MNYITLNYVFCEKIIQIGPIGKKCQIRFLAIYSGAEGVNSLPLLISDQSNSGLRPDDLVTLRIISGSEAHLLILLLASNFFANFLTEIFDFIGDPTGVLEILSSLSIRNRFDKSPVIKNSLSPKSSSIK